MLLIATQRGLTRLKFTEKMSGTSVNLTVDPLFESGFVSLDEVMRADLSQDTMDFILDNLRFYRGERTADNAGECIWWTTIDHDTRCKLAVLERAEYAEIKREFESYFGVNWMKHYIRFNH